MGCPLVHGDNSQALASGLSNVQMDKHGITILYHLHQCRQLAHHEIVCAKVGIGGINLIVAIWLSMLLSHFPQHLNTMTVY